MRGLVLLCSSSAPFSTHALPPQGPARVCDGRARLLLFTAKLRRFAAHTRGRCDSVCVPGRAQLPACRADPGRGPAASRNRRPGRASQRGSSCQSKYPCPPAGLPLPGSGGRARLLPFTACWVGCHVVNRRVQVVPPVGDAASARLDCVMPSVQHVLLPVVALDAAVAGRVAAA